MNAPPIEISPSERILDAKEAASLACTAIIRSVVRNYDGIVLESESVSHDHKYGYIYRYRIVRMTSGDDGSLPSDDTKTYRNETRVVAYTHDGKKFSVATHPMFQLPTTRKD
jgi:hypothetical protein